MTFRFEKILPVLSQCWTDFQYIFVVEDQIKIKFDLQPRNSNIGKTENILEMDLKLLS